MIQLQNAVNFFSKLILDDLKGAGVAKPVVAGGCLRDYFLGELSYKTDIDIFFPNEEDYLKAEKWFKDNKCKIVYESGNSIRFRHKKRIFDVVKKYYIADPQSLIESFDFTVCQIATDGEKVYHSESFFIDLAKKQLMYTGSPFPANSIWRLSKYLMKGFRICREQTQKVADDHASWALIQTLNTPADESDDTVEYDSNEGSTYRSID